MKYKASRFFNNRECEYFPCHKGLDEEDFNCLFCYCPLFALGEKCGGNYKFFNGVKDCSDCIKPHIPDTYDEIVERFGEIVEAMKAIQSIDKQR